MPYQPDSSLDPVATHTRFADRYETAALEAMEKHAATDDPNALAFAAVVNALLSVGERIKAGDRDIAEAISDMDVTLQSIKEDMGQQAIDQYDATGDLAVELAELGSSVDLVASYVRAGLPLTTRLRMRWSVRRWVKRHNADQVAAEHAGAETAGVAES